MAGCEEPEQEKEQPGKGQEVAALRFICGVGRRSRIGHGIEVAANLRRVEEVLGEGFENIVVGFGEAVGADFVSVFAEVLVFEFSGLGHRIEIVVGGQGGV